MVKTRASINDVSLLVEYSIRDCNSMLTEEPILAIWLHFAHTLVILVGSGARLIIARRVEMI